MSRNAAFLATYSLVMFLFVSAPVQAETRCPGTISTSTIIVGAGEQLIIPPACIVTILSRQSIIVGDGGQVVNQGEITVRDGFIEVLLGGLFVNEENGHIISESIVRIRGRLSNRGLITNHEVLFLSETGRLDNLGGTIINYARFTVSGHPVGGSGFVENRGGTIVNQAELSVRRGILDNRGGTILNKAGRALGSRTATIIVSDEGFLQNRDGLAGDGVIQNFGGAELRNRVLASDPGGIANALGAEIVNWGLTSGRINHPPVLPGFGAFFNCPFAWLAATVAAGIIEVPFCRGVGDLDGDGLRDVVDAKPGDPTGPLADPDGLTFNDAGLGTVLTFGRVRVSAASAPVDLNKELRDSAAGQRRDGIDVEALVGGGGDPALIEACGISTIVVDEGESLTITCGSITLEVQVGPVEATLVAADAREFEANISSGNTLRFDPETASFTADGANPDVIVILGLGGEFEVDPGASVDAPEVAAIDIKPGSNPAPINLAGNGVIPVVIYGTDTTDVGDIDITTLAFGPAAAGATHRGHREDVNGDGLDDLVSHYLTAEAGIALLEDTACLSWETLGRVTFVGCDEIRAVGACGLIGLEPLFLLALLEPARRRRRSRSAQWR